MKSEESISLYGYLILHSSLFTLHLLYYLFAINNVDTLLEVLEATTEEVVDNARLCRLINISYTLDACNDSEVDSSTETTTSISLADSSL